MVSPALNVVNAAPTNPRPELSIAPELNTRLVPVHARKELLQRGIDLETFVPMPAAEMTAQLE